MKEIVKRSIEELNDLLPKEKKLVIENSTPLVGEKSNLESIDLVNLFVSLEKNLKERKKLDLTFDEIIAKDVPEGYKYKIVNKDEVPTDRSFRDAWTVADSDLTDGVGISTTALP